MAFNVCKGSPFWGRKRQYEDIGLSIWKRSQSVIIILSCNYRLHLATNACVVMYVVMLWSYHLICMWVREVIFSLSKMSCQSVYDSLSVAYFVTLSQFFVHFVILFQLLVHFLTLSSFDTLSCNFSSISTWKLSLGGVLKRLKI